jgi:hypothetical protein
VPSALAEALEDAVEEPIALVLTTWRQAIANHELASLTADQVSNVVTELFNFSVLDPVFFEVWEPAVIHTLTATSGSGFDEGWHNPFLAVSRVRNEVVT